VNALATIIQPMSITDVERIAVAIAKGGLFGSKDPNAVLTLCLLAQAEGQHPAVVFRDYHIIQGKPAKKADAMLRDFINAGGKVEWHALTDECADATFSHPSGEARIDWTLQRAQTAGIANPMWKKYPRQMLRSRVISEGVRTVFPGATSGLYEVGEVQDITGDTSEPPMAPAIEHQTVEDAPIKRQKLEGPYTSLTALKAAYQQLDRNIRQCESVDELTDLLEKEETVALIDQLKRDARGYVVGSDKLPAEHKPLMQLISETETQLKALAEEGEEMVNRMRAG